MIKKEVAALMFLLLLLTSCTSLDAEKQCSVDADCVAASCCHPADAVNTMYAPDCQDVACTMQCEPGTLDCGQGRITCLENRCVVIINKVEELKYLLQ